MDCCQIVRIIHRTMSSGLTWQVCLQVSYILWFCDYILAVIELRRKGFQLSLAFLFASAFPTRLPNHNLLKYLHR